MNLLNLGNRQKQTVEVPVLVKFWPEDGVWNANALDVPVAVFGESFEEARANFEEAITSHFQALHELGKLQAVIEVLKSKAKERGYFERIQPREVFEQVLVAPINMEPCYAH